MLRQVDDVPEMMKRPAKPRREAGQKTESSRSVLTAAAAVVLRADAWKDKTRRDAESQFGGQAK